MFDIASAEYIDNYKIKFVFEDGKEGVIDFSIYLDKGGVFNNFKDIQYFKSFRLDKEIGNITWNNEIDIAPEILYSKATHTPLPRWMEN